MRGEDDFQLADDGFKRYTLEVPTTEDDDSSQVLYSYGPPFQVSGGAPQRRELVKPVLRLATVGGKLKTP